jgi:hypothetical protein
MLDRLSRCDKPWPSYFQLAESDVGEEDGSDVDGGSDEEAVGSSESWSDDSGSEQDNDGSDYEE